MAGGRKALVVATYEYADRGLRRLTAPEHDAEALAEVLADAEIAGFDVTTMINQPHHVVGEAIADFYADCRRDDLTLLYFSGHGLKDDEGRLHLAMTNTRREALLFTAISAAQLNDAMDACGSRRKVLVLDCCYSGAFPAGRTAKADEAVHTLERFQGKGRAVLTASDATQYAFEGNALSGSAASSVFTRHLVEAIRTGAADLDEDGDIALDELYSYVRERVVAEMPQMRPKKLEDVDGRIVLARNVNWALPAHLRHAIESPIAAQRLGAVEGLAHLHRMGNDIVRSAVVQQLGELASDDSRSVSSAATTVLEDLARPAGAGPVGGGPERAGPSPLERVETTAEARPVGASRRAEPPRSPAPVAPDVRPADEARPAGPAGDPEPIGAVAGGGAAPSQLPLVLLLVLAGGVLALVSRFLVFETTYTYLAAEFGIHWISWLIGVGLPLLLAFQVLVLKGGVPWAVALAGGLVAGAALAQLDLVLATGASWLTPESGELPGPGWWTTALSALTLGCCLILLLRQPALHVRPGLRRDWRAFSGVLLVAGGLMAWLWAFSEVSPWVPSAEPALLLAVVCLPVAVLDLRPPQRLLALAAVSVLGLWAATGHVQALLRGEFRVDAQATVVALVGLACALAGCWLAQAWAGPRAEAPATGAALRR